jgi:DNA-binding response OmpR family regulator
MKRPRLLIVEDDDAVRLVLVYAFEVQGYDVLSASDGAAFAEVVSGALLLDGPRLPDAIITDVSLPSFEGLSIVEGFRRAGWNVPVFVISALPPDELAPRVERLGGAFFFPKPFDLCGLEERVRQVLASPAAPI